MKRLFLLFAVTLIAVCGSTSITKAQGPNRQGWYEDVTLYGDIETLTMTTYYVEDKFGELINGDVEELVDYCFNTAGDVTKYTRYGSDGSLVWKRISKFDSQGRITEEAGYEPDGSLYGKWISKYNSAGYKIEEGEYSTSGSLRFKTIFKYDAQGEMIEEAQYDSDGGTREKIIYSYDSAGNKIKKATYDADNSLDIYTTYKYDANGNMIQEAIYNEYGSLIQKSIYKYLNGVLIEKTTYDADGELSYTWAYVHDSHGNVIEEIMYKSEALLPQSRIVYEIAYRK